MSALKTTVQVRLYPASDQAARLRAHCQEYISTSNVLVAALDSDVLPDGGKGVSTKDCTAMLPSAVKHQALRDARFVWQRSFTLGVLPIVRTPMCQWNNQNWRLEGDRLVLPVAQGGTVQRISIRCAAVALQGTPGVLRITRKRGKWVAESALGVPEPDPTTGEAIMGIDLGIKVPAVVHIIGTGQRFFGNGRQQRAKRRQFYARRTARQHIGKVRAVRTSQGKERRWMRDSNHKRSHLIVTHAKTQGVGVMRREQLAGIRQRTARTRRGANSRKAAKARTHNRLMATWTFHQLATFIAYKAARAGIAVQWVDPAHTSQRCPACLRLNTADDRHSVCADCGWRGHRDAVGAINSSRSTPGTGWHGQSAGATVAGVDLARTVDGLPETALG
jgi:IS605 OrfB family transposase